jgi:Esterase PHB depolymerase
VKTMLSQDAVREATRLTREGQLAEATALLQRMLRGESAPPHTSGRIALLEREPPTIDAKADPVEGPASPHLERATPAQPSMLRALMLRALLDRAQMRPGFSLRDGIKRAPPSIRDIVPEGARFIEGTYSNAAGSRAYRLFIPNRYREGQPIPLVVMLHGCTQSPDISRPARG